MTTIAASMSVKERIAQGRKMAAEAAAAAEKRKQAGGFVSVASSTVILKSGVQKDGRNIVQKALIRPIYQFDQSIGYKVHDKFNMTDWKLSIRAICAQELGKPCKYCVDARANKLVAKDEIFVPVYLHGIQESEVGTDVWTRVTYTSKHEDGTETTTPVQGFKLICCKMNSDVLTALETIDSFSGDITSCNFEVMKQGTGKDTKTTCKAQPPTPMKAPLRAAISGQPLKKFQDLVLDLYPYQVVPGSNAGVIGDYMDELDSLDGEYPESTVQPLAVDAFANENEW